VKEWGGVDLFGSDRERVNLNHWNDLYYEYMLIDVIWRLTVNKHDIPFCHISLD